MKYLPLTQCVGKTLVKILDPTHSESLILVFADAWTLLQIQSDDDAYLEMPYHRDKTRLVNCGYDKAELIEAGILEHEDLIAIKKNRQQFLESQIREAEQQLKNLKTRLAAEGGAT
jgi:hypothetical protein